MIIKAVDNRKVLIKIFGVRLLEDFMIVVSESLLGWVIGCLVKEISQLYKEVWFFCSYLIKNFSIWELLSTWRHCEWEVFSIELECFEMSLPLWKNLIWLDWLCHVLKIILCSRLELLQREFPRDSFYLFSLVFTID